MASFFFALPDEKFIRRKGTNLPKRDAQNMGAEKTAQVSKKKEKTEKTESVVVKKWHLVKAERKCDARRLRAPLQAAT